MIEGNSKRNREYKPLKNHIFTNGKFSLRTIGDLDIEKIRVWRNAQINILRQPKPISRSEQAKYFDKSVWPQMKLDYPNNILLAFEYDGVLIGYGGLVHISWIDLRSEISFLLNPEHVEDDEVYKIYFSEFLDLIKSISYSILGFNRLFTETFEFRALHISVLESKGFILEGVMLKHIIFDGKSINSLIHGCIKNDAR
tara:strand:- start:36 stop:629 length:594 start_codon:yes stop_codon:yes gene_type:complete